MAVTTPSCVFNSGLRNASGKTEQSLEHSLKQRSQYTTVYHSISQYTTVYRSIPQYTTVYHSIPQYTTVYLKAYFSTVNSTQRSQYTTVYLTQQGSIKYTTKRAHLTLSPVRQLEWLAHSS